MRFFPRKSVSWRRSSQKNRRQRGDMFHHDPLIDRDLIVAGGMPIDRTTPGSIGSSRSPSRPRCERLEDRALMSVQFVVDPLLDNRPISPFIYGVNQTLPGYTNFTFERLGGDATSEWNWVNGDTNAGQDFFYQNQSLSSSTGGTNGPGGAAIPIITGDYAHNAATLLTVPINGYVAANTANDAVLYNPVTTVTAAASSTATVISVAQRRCHSQRSVLHRYRLRRNGSDVRQPAQNQLTVVRGICGDTATPQAGDSVYFSPDVRNAGRELLADPVRPGAPVQAGCSWLVHTQSDPRRARLRGRVRQLGQHHVSLRRNQRDHSDLVSARQRAGPLEHHAHREFNRTP